MRKLYTVFGLLIVAALVLTACATPTAAPEAPVVEPTDAPTGPVPLVVAYEEFSQKFSPFFVDTGYDLDVANLTQIGLLTTDRVGGIVHNAIEGEVRNYNGTDYTYTGPANTSVVYDEATDTTKYTAKIREDLKFSDGEPVTADDIIFTYYTYLDPSYVGSTSLGSYGIIGLKDYQTQTTSEVFDKYSALSDEILAAGRDHVWAEGDAWTQEQQDDFWTRIDEGWKAEVQAIIDYVAANYTTDEYTAEYFGGRTAADVQANEGLGIAYAMAMWGFGELNEAGTFLTASQASLESALTALEEQSAEETAGTEEEKAAGEAQQAIVDAAQLELEPLQDKFSAAQDELATAQTALDELAEDATQETKDAAQATLETALAAVEEAFAALEAPQAALDEALTVITELPGYVSEEEKEEAIDNLKMAIGTASIVGKNTIEDLTETNDPQELITIADTVGNKTVFNLTDTFPTFDDYYNETFAAYEGDVKAAFPYESPDGIDVYANVNAAFVGYWGPLDEAMGGTGVPNISGIVKVDDYTVEVTTTGFEAPAVYSILGIQITPMHYYGDPAKYDYENNKFGFDFGDLSKQESLTATPMGAGPYKFVRFENKVVYFEANEFYFKGAPKIKEIQFKTTTSAEVPSAVQTGTVDAGELSGTRARFEEVASYNSNGEITGDVITTNKVDNLGYGYAGINASTVNVAGEPGSDASKNLRKGIATILAAYRDVAIDSYYGEAAAVINYPISNTSWAAPQPTDEDYKVAFSTDINGEPIYTQEMTPEEKYAAAEVAALGFLEAAGYTVADGKVTAAPAGAKLDYEVIVPGGGTGDHPAFAILTGAKESLANIGIELKINDPADSNILWDALDAGTQELWTAAWGATIDPDMYQVYHSSGIVGLGGSDSNHYHIADSALDQLILDARASDDQNYRKAIYKQALDIVIDWAVEIPTYQRQNCTVFSTERLNIDTLTPDITTFWGWQNDIELLEMR